MSLLAPGESQDEVAELSKSTSSQPSLGARRGSRNSHQNRLASEVEEKIIDYGPSFPMHPGSQANRTWPATNVYSAKARGIWPRVASRTRYKRMTHLGRHAQGESVVRQEAVLRLVGEIGRSTPSTSSPQLHLAGANILLEAAGDKIREASDRWQRWWRGTVPGMSF